MVGSEHAGVEGRVGVRGPDHKHGEVARWRLIGCHVGQAGPIHLTRNVSRTPSVTFQPSVPGPPTDLPSDRARRHKPYLQFTLKYSPSSASLHPIHQKTFVTGDTSMDGWVRVHDAATGEELECGKVSLGIGGAKEAT